MVYLTKISVGHIMWLRMVGILLNREFEKIYIRGLEL